MTKPHSLFTLAIATLVSCLSLNAAAPDSTALNQLPTARAIAQHLKAGANPTDEEKAIIEGWLSSDQPFLQALASWLVARISCDVPDLDQRLTERLPAYTDVAAGVAKVASVRRATRAQATAQQTAALATLTSDSNPFAAFEAVRALSEVDMAQALAKARELYENAAFPLRPYVANFLRGHGDNPPPQPIPESVYKTLVDATSRF
jgi:hypothetical protein